METLLAHCGLLAVFMIVLAQQMGLPIPTTPVLMVAGALAIEGRFGLVPLFCTALAACLLSDAMWYAGARRYGVRVMQLLPGWAKPDEAMVLRMPAQLARWKAIGLFVGRGLPYGSLLAGAAAGAAHVGFWSFIALDAIALSILTGVPIVLGAVLHDSINEALGRVHSIVMWASAFIPLAAALVVLAIRAIRKRRARPAARAGAQDAIAARKIEGAATVLHRSLASPR